MRKEMAATYTNAKERVTEPNNRWSLVCGMAFAGEPIDNLNPPPTDSERGVYREVLESPHIIEIPFD